MTKIFILFLTCFIFTSVSCPMKIPDNKQPGNAIISFGLIADVQYCECESQGSRYFSNSLDKLREAIFDFNTVNVDFVINLGDIIEQDFRSFTPIMDLLEESDKKVYHLLGNHDYYVRNKYKKKVNSILTGEESYYSFSTNGFRFIALNSCDISIYSGSLLSTLKAGILLGKLQRQGRPNAFEWNGAIGKKQIEWFKSELTKAREMNEYVLIFSHHTIDPEGTHNIYNREEILNLVSDYDNVIAWFSGHNHSGGYSKYRNIHFVTLKGMVETSDSSSWAVVEINEDKILIKGRGREESRILSYR